MATRAQRIDLGVTPYYHCMSRCVRRAFLCGKDRYSGANYEHRRGWVRARLGVLAEIFAIDVCAYAVMNNHFHLVVHVDEARANAWSESDVAERYTRLHSSCKSLNPMKLPKKARAALLNTWRARLSSVSWLMRSLNEHIARKANKEDSVTGRFWESRFKCQALVDEVGLLRCMAYVDLNPVRAGLATTLASSDFTSIQERLRGGKGRVPSKLAGFSDQEAHGHRVPIPIPYDDYIQLLRWTGSQIAQGKRGKLQSEPTLLREVGVTSGAWMLALQTPPVGTAVGAEEALQTLATSRSQQWLQGIHVARMLRPER